MNLLKFFNNIYQYREYLIQSVARDLKVKYKRSVFGYLWAMAHPFAMMIVLTIVFSQLMKIPAKDYAVFLFSGLLAWNLFHSTTLMSLHSIRANARLFGQIAVPKYIFVLSIVFSNLVNYVLALIPLFAIMLVVGRGIPSTALLLPIVLIPFLFVVIGVSLILATANVFFEDTAHLTEVGLSVLYFLTPILYEPKILPERIRAILEWTPIFELTNYFRDILYYGVPLQMSSYFFTLAVSTAILLFGYIFFERNQKKFLYFI